MPRRRIVAAGVAGVALLVFESEALAMLSGPRGWVLALALLALLWWSGRTIWRRAWRRLRRGRAGPELLIVCSTLTMIAQAVLLVVEPPRLAAAGATLWLGHAFVLVALWNLARALRRDIRGGPARIAGRLEALRPAFVRLVSVAGERFVPLADVRAGDRIQVAAGERVPVDGRLASSHGRLDEGLLSGALRTPSRHRGDRILAGTLNRGESVVVQATRESDEGTLAQLIRSVYQAGRDRPDGARQYARLSAATLGAMILIAAVAVLVHSLGGLDAPALVTIALGVMAVTAPPALVLASTLSVRMALTRVEEYGVRVRRGSGLRAAQSVDVLLLDADGVVTVGAPEVVAVEPVDVCPVRDLFRFAASLTAVAEPGYEKVTDAALERGIGLARVSGYQALRGGHKGRIGGRHVILGTAGCLAELGIENPLSVRGGEFQDEGSTPWFVVVDGLVAGVLALGDPIRPEAAEAVVRVRGLGVRVIIMTSGDERTARAVARVAGVAEVVARDAPEARAAHVHALQRQGLGVGLVGNGLNDLAALVQADVAFAMATASDVVTEAADMILVGDDLAGVSNGLAMARAMRRSIRQNTAVAYAYNGLAGVVAAGVLYPAFGWLPGAGLLLATSLLATLTVIANAGRLRFELLPAPGIPKLE